MKSSKVLAIGVIIIKSLVLRESLWLDGVDFWRMLSHSVKASAPRHSQTWAFNVLFKLDHYSSRPQEQLQSDLLQGLIKLTNLYLLVTDDSSANRV